jgi:hypothetical protein
VRIVASQNDGNGTSHHFAAAQQSVAFGVKADIEIKRGAGNRLPRMTKSRQHGAAVL